MTVDPPLSEAQARLKRLKHRSWYRGFKEADLILGHFADRHLDSLTPAQVDRYEALLGLDDHDIYNWIVGRAPVPADHDTDIMAMIQQFSRSEGALWDRPGPIT